jgi:hypothetical protein
MKFLLLVASAALGAALKRQSLNGQWTATGSDPGMSLATSHHKLNNFPFRNHNPECHSSRRNFLRSYEQRHHPRHFLRLWRHQLQLGRSERLDVRFGVRRSRHFLCQSLSRNFKLQLTIPSWITT